MAKEQKTFVLTGGPCGGKSSGLVHLQETLVEAGFGCVIVPEAATLAINAGFRPGQTIPVLDFQRLNLKTVASLEDNWRQAALRLKADRAVVLCDRGMMDSKAYVPADQFAAVREEMRAAEVAWRDKRYDAVFHLRTAAMGAEEFYTLANNAARSETPAQALELDQRTLRAWTGHPHVAVIDNSTDFAGKMLRLRQEVFRALGVPEPLEIERKFLIGPVADKDFPVHSVVVDIEQAYLLNPNPNEVVRVRRRGQDGAFVYYRTVKKHLAPGVNVETESQIDEREYFLSLGFRQPETKIIKKRRRCFIYKELYFELDEFLDPAGLWLLEIELTKQQQKVILPPFLNIVREVTEDKTYSNYQLARAC